MKDAEDILQDTLIQYMRKAPAFESAAHEKAWLLRVTINISKNKLKRSRLHREMELSDIFTDTHETEDLAFTLQTGLSLTDLQDVIVSVK